MIAALMCSGSSAQTDTISARSGGSSEVSIWACFGEFSVNWGVNCDLAGSQVFVILAVSVFGTRVRFPPPPLFLRVLVLMPRPYSCALCACEQTSLMLAKTCPAQAGRVSYSLCVVLPDDWKWKVKTYSSSIRFLHHLQEHHQSLCEVRQPPRPPVKSSGRVVGLTDSKSLLSSFALT